MNKNIVRLALWLSAALTLALVGCAGGPPKPVKTHIAVAATAATNPDPKGRPSPVVVRVYQLKSDASFNGAEFFALFDDDKKVLGADLAGRDEFELAPGESRALDLSIPGDVRFVGAIAAFRDIRNSVWRGLTPLPKKLLTSTAVKISVDKQAVTVALGN